MELTVLICEDEKISHGWVKRVLRSWGYRTLSAYTGHEAIEQTKSEHPDIILLDMSFPDMGGREILEAIRGEAGMEHTPVITMSAMSSSEHAESVKGLKVSASLEKPIHPEELRRLVAELGSEQLRDNGTKPLFILVDHSGVHQKVVERVLDEAGCESMSVDRCEMAFGLIRNVKCSGFILDIGDEPVETGEFQERIVRLISESLPVIVLCPVIDQGIVELLTRYGIEDILVKPVVPTRLHAAIRKLTTKAMKKSTPTPGEFSVLIVEDFTITANLVRKAIGELNCRTRCARNAAEALELIEEESPGLMLLDLNLPGMGGVDLVNALKERSLSVPFAAITAERNRRRLSQVREAGALRVFQKPVLMDELRRFVRKYIADRMPSASVRECKQVLLSVQDTAFASVISAALRHAEITFHQIKENDPMTPSAETPQVLLVDFSGEDRAIEEVKRLKAASASSQLKTVGIAENLDDELRRNLRELGVDAVFDKPVDIPKLIQRVGSLLEGTLLEVDIREFATEFLNELALLPEAENELFCEQVKRLGHNLAGTAGLISNEKLRDLGLSLEEAGGKRSTEACGELVGEIHAILESLAASAKQESPVS